MRRQHWFLVAATLTLLLAAFFRLWLLSDVPPGLAQDEVLDAGMPAYILAGNHAFFFRQGYGHEPLYHYFGIPFYLALGENVLAARLPAVTLGLLLVALALRWARREFGSGTAVVAGLGLAISWWPIVFSRVGIRPILEPVLLLLFAWFWPKRPVVAGLFLGLSLYSYTGARVVFAIPALLAIYFFLTQRGKGAKWSKEVRGALIVLGVSLVVALPLFLTLQADPTLQQRVDQLAGPLEALQAGDVGPVLQSVVNTLGVFSFTGDPRWTYTLPERPLFDWGTAVFFYAGLLFVLWRWRQPKFAFVLIWLGVTLIPSAVTPQSPSTVRLVGALPVVYVLVGVGMTAVYRYLVRQKTVSAVRWGVTAVLVVLFAVNVYRTVNDGFIRWPQAETTRLNHYQTVLLDMARHWRVNPADNLVVADAFFEPIDRDSLILDLGNNPHARWVQTGSEVAGAVVWPVGGNGRLYVPEFAPLHPTLLAAAGIAQEPLFRSEAEPSFAVYVLPERPQFSGTVFDPPVLFENAITLEGYQFYPLGAEKILHLITLWRVQAPLPVDLRAFIHVLDNGGNLIAQHDGFDAASTELQVGDRVIQHHVVDLNQASGLVQVYVGLYTLHDQIRLKPAGQSRDIVVLGAGISVDEK
jgi:4-amino-4-deoxy-L-arabinose transferase-like glycosyltransferase